MNRPARFGRIGARLAAAALPALGCAHAAAHAGEDFGRLFFTLAERRALDAPPAPPPPPAPAPEAAASAPAPVRSRRIDGILQGPDGRVTIWLDGLARPAAPDFRIRATLQLIPRAAPQLRLYVGDHWPPPRADETGFRLAPAAGLAEAGAPQ